MSDFRGNLWGGVQSAGSLGDGHFGHVRFKFFLKIDFDGHLLGGDVATLLRAVGSGIE